MVLTNLRPTVYNVNIVNVDQIITYQNTMIVHDSRFGWSFVAGESQHNYPLTGNKFELPVGYDFPTSENIGRFNNGDKIHVDIQNLSIGGAIKRNRRNSRNIKRTRRNSRRYKLQSRNSRNSRRYKLQSRRYKLRGG
jgi:hypothetical protein